MIVSKGLLAACVVVGLALAVQTMRVSRLETKLATEQRDRASDRAAALQATADGITAAREEEQLRIEDQQEVINEQAKALARARADAAAATAAAGSAERLRKRAAELAAGCRAGAEDPAAPGPGAPADAPGHLLAHMLGRIDEAARGVAEFADEASTAGATCEGAYDALRRRQ